MKKALLFVSLFTLGSGFAQDCTKLFISEYVEGWSNNKALEIYNPTNQTINLSEYVVARFSNGSTSATVEDAVQLSGTIAPYDVYVAVLDKRDPNGEDLEAPVWDSLQAKADGFYSPVYAETAGDGGNNTFYFNGDDVVMLLKGTLSGGPTATLPNTLVPYDIFGKLGERPTNAAGGTSAPTGGWSTAFPYTGGANGVIVTADHSMVRKGTIQKGATSLQLSFFNPLLEWDTLPPVIQRLDENGNPLFGQSGNPILDGNWSTLGWHNCMCNPTWSVAEISDIKFDIFPNPSENGIFQVSSPSDIQTVTVYNSVGQVVKTITNAGKEVTVKLNDVHGVYLVKIDTGNGVATKRIIIK